MILVIGDAWANDYDGAVWLHTTDGTFVETLDRQDSSGGSWFGLSVVITDDKVLVGATNDDDGRMMVTLMLAVLMACL